jgi:hypothetical protein
MLCAEIARICAKTSALAYCQRLPPRALSRKLFATAQGRANKMTPLTAQVAHVRLGEQVALFIWLAVPPLFFDLWVVVCPRMLNPYN